MSARILPIHRPHYQSQGDGTARKVATFTQGERVWRDVIVRRGGRLVVSKSERKHRA